MLEKIVTRDVKLNPQSLLKLHAIISYFYIIYTIIFIIDVTIHKSKKKKQYFIYITHNVIIKLHPTSFRIHNLKTKTFDIKSRVRKTIQLRNDICKEKREEIKKKKKKRRNRIHVLRRKSKETTKR